MKAIIKPLTTTIPLKHNKTLLCWVWAVTNTDEQLASTRSLSWTKSQPWLKTSLNNMETETSSIWVKKILIVLRSGPHCDSKTPHTHTEGHQHTTLTNPLWVNVCRCATATGTVTAIQVGLHLSVRSRDLAAAWTVDPCNMKVSTHLHASATRCLFTQSVLSSIMEWGGFTCIFSPFVGPCMLWAW